MKKILLSWKGFEKNKIFTYTDSNNSNGPWKHLKSKLNENNYDIETIDMVDISRSDFVFFVDETSLGIPKKSKNILKRFIKSFYNKKAKSLYDKVLEAKGRSNMALMLWEPAVIDPDNYTQNLYDKFDTILTWNDDLVDNKKFYKFFHPYQEKKHDYQNIPFLQRKTLVNISMNKYSSHKNDLYKERRKSILFFEQNLKSEFDLWGYGWNKPTNKYQKYFSFLTPRYKSYLGECEDKQKTLEKYKFSICYENIQNEKGWITEKIFDCFHAKNIPIYWGASNITDYIPQNTFIDRRNFKNHKELLNFIMSIDEDKYNEYIENINIFLASDAYRKFSDENFSSNIIKTLKLK